MMLDFLTYRAVDKCPNCPDRNVQILGHQSLSDINHRLKLFCPNCRWEGRGIFTAEAYKKYGRRSRLKQLELIAVYQRESDDRFVETLRRALEADALLPEDF